MLFSRTKIYFLVVGEAEAPPHGVFGLIRGHNLWLSDGCLCHFVCAFVVLFVFIFSCVRVCLYLKLVP